MNTLLIFPTSSLASPPIMAMFKQYVFEIPWAICEVSCLLQLLLAWSVNTKATQGWERQEVEEKQ
jgi:hypothetical protein